MKRICSIIALVVLIAVMGAMLVACVPSKGMDAAKVAWKAIVKEELEGATGVKVESVEYKRFNLDNEFGLEKNRYYFMFVVSYAKDGSPHRSTWYCSCATSGDSYSANYRYANADTYNNLEEKKKSSQTKVTKKGELSSNQLSQLMEYYEEIKPTVWLPPVEEEEEVAD